MCGAGDKALDYSSGGRGFDPTDSSSCLNQEKSGEIEKNQGKLREIRGDQGKLRKIKKIRENKKI